MASVIAGIIVLVFGALLVGPMLWNLLLSPNWCPKCKKKTHPGLYEFRYYCYSCGTKLVRYTPRCPKGHRVDSGSRFCPYCGTEIPKEAFEYTKEG